MRLIAMTLLCSFAVAGATPAAAQAARLQVEYPSGALDATCALVRVEGPDAGATLYFVTSARLFKTATGAPLPPARAVRVTLGDGRVIPVPREGVLMPRGSLVDVALLRARAPAGTSAPAAISFDAPAQGSAFRIAGYDRDGAAVSVDEHVRFASTRLVVGDRDASAVRNCIGAPAIAAGSIRGIVSECEPHRAPVVTLLSNARAFITRSIPRLPARPTPREQP